MYLLSIRWGEIGYIEIRYTATLAPSTLLATIILGSLSATVFRSTMMLLTHLDCGVQITFTKPNEILLFSYKIHWHCFDVLDRVTHGSVQQIMKLYSLLHFSFIASFMDDPIRSLVQNLLA